MYKKFILVVFVVAFALSAFAGTLAENKKALIGNAVKTAPSIDAATLKSWMETGKDFVLLDVRTAKEQSAVTINADNYAYYPRGVVEFYFTAKYPELDKTIVVYCKAGARGAFVTNRLKELGYTNVYNLTGGIKAWMKAGYPVENMMGSFKLVEE